MCACPPPIRRRHLTAWLALLSTAAPAEAHQEWFVNNPDAYPPDPEALLGPGVLLGAVIALAVTLAWRAVAARLPVPELAFLAPARRLAGLVPWVPRLLSAHLGVSLLILAFDRAVLDPGIHVPAGAGGTLLLVPQAVVGVLLIAGVLVRPAAVATMLAGPVLVALTGPEALATLAVLLGIAVFLVLLPPRLQDGGRVEPDLGVLRWATGALKLGAGVTLVSLAVVEKLANPAMARAMLAQEPGLNLLTPLGVSADGFALFAGSDRTDVRVTRDLRRPATGRRPRRRGPLHRHTGTLRHDGTAGASPGLRGAPHSPAPRQPRGHFPHPLRSTPTRNTASDRRYR